VRVTVYGRPGCGLCDELMVDLVEMQRKMGFVLVERNIEEDAADLARYAYLIPVLDIEGGPLLYPPHHWDVVEATLKAAIQQSSFSSHHDE
jgi:hypothetical protein